jgi:mRNA-degrading endonuclease RelE of RelBE toxin-antitoxin system
VPTHEWHFEISRRARVQIRELREKDRRAVFGSIRALLEAVNPKALRDIKKIIGSDDEWRKRQGDYRIFFTIDVGEIEVNKHRYKGIINIVRVEHRSTAYDP